MWVTAIASHSCEGEKKQVCLFIVVKSEFSRGHATLERLSSVALLLNSSIFHGWHPRFTKRAQGNRMFPGVRPISHHISRRAYVKCPMFCGTNAGKHYGLCRGNNAAFNSRRGADSKSLHDRSYETRGMKGALLFSQLKLMSTQEAEFPCDSAQSSKPPKIFSG